MHQTFSPLLLYYCSVYLGRAPSLSLKKNNDIGDKNDHSIAVARDSNKL
jgi:hypothetical protein